MINTTEPAATFCCCISSKYIQSFSTES